MNEPDIPAGNYQQGYSREQMQDYGWRMAEWARQQALEEAANHIQRAFRKHGSPMAISFAFVDEIRRMK